MKTIINSYHRNIFILSLKKDSCVFRLSNTVRSKRESLKPMVRLVANIHGNEAVGREILLHLAYHLLHGYSQVTATLSPPPATWIQAGNYYT